MSALYIPIRHVMMSKCHVYRHCVEYLRGVNIQKPYILGELKMSGLSMHICELLSDAYLFPAIQIVLVIFFFFSLLMNFMKSISAGRGGFSVTVTRGKESMGRFFGFYAAINGLLIAICLSTDYAKDHRVFWSVLDTMLVAYTCLYNIWFRNKLLSWVDHLTKIETH